MKMISTQGALDEFCKTAGSRPFLCVDTEFMRETTFYSQLCLIQAATDETEVIIDPLADDIDLTPFLALMNDPNITKVMHAARQDLEIFYHINQQVPAPLFDTQIAAMALGFGESVGYSTLVKGRLGISLDKGARFTDWSRRPLSEKQLSYAMGDVTHLRDMYPAMVEELDARGRIRWVSEEMQSLLSEDLYKNDPEKAWERLKIRNSRKPYLAALKAVTAWRERKAINRDVPRRRVLKDDALHAIAQQRPKTVAALAKVRGVPSGFERSETAKAMINELNKAIENADKYAPTLPRVKHMPPNIGPASEMLKTLLRLRTEYEDIAPRLVASNKEIDMIAAFGEKADVPALKGWRREVFGEDALKLLKGEIVLKLEGRKVIAIMS